MKRSINHKDLYVGQLVVVTDHPETQVYTVTAIHNRTVALQWREGTRHCNQHFEKYALLKPTLQQIEHSIAANGALVSRSEI